MDKYLLFVFIFLIGGMIIGISQNPIRLELFYAGLGGAIIIIAYSTMKNRKAQQALRREKRKSKKKKF